MSHNRYQRTCPSCNGKGSHLAMGEEPCPHCAGTGRDTKSDCWAEPCRFCNGKRRQPYCRNVPCKNCRGSGIVNY